MRGRIIALLVVTSPRIAAAGALDRFESAHAPSSPSSSSSREPGRASSSSSAPAAPSLPTSSPSRPGGREIKVDDAYGYVLAPLVFACFAPFFGVAYAPRHRPRLDPYDRTWEPARTEELNATDESRMRHWEVTVSGFTARNEAVFSRTFGVRAFPASWVLAYDWERMFETPGDGSLARLDRHRWHVTSNPLAKLTRSELFPIAGASLMRGNHATWGIDVGLEARIYPVRPFAFAASSVATIFFRGPVLFDSRAEAGLTFDRFEIRAGIRSLWQRGAQGFFGPTATIAIRL